MITQATFLYKTDKPGGFGFVLGPKAFTPEQLTHMFEGPHVEQFMKDSNSCLKQSPGVIRDYYNQLEGMANQVNSGDPPSIDQAVLAALNIMWLTKWGFMVNDQFNGVQFTRGVGLDPNDRPFA